MKIILLLAQCLALEMSSVCCQRGWSPQYGLLTLKDSSGHELYVKREVSGTNHDLIIISTNKDYCAHPDSAKEYIFDNLSDAVYYKLNDDVLSLFRNGPLELKKDFHSSIQIDYHDLTIIEWMQLKKDSSKLGLKRLEVPLDETLAVKCDGTR